jgi:four helix bundle protein
MKRINTHRLQFGFEKLEAYHLSIEFLAMAFQFIKFIPSGNHQLVDQFKRAAISVPLNIAEGSGKMSVAEKKRFYSIARGSSMECAAILDVLAVMDIASDEELLKGREILNSIAAILTRISRG